MKPRILVVGSSNTDMIARVPRIPRPGETILGGEFITAAGGKGALADFFPSHHLQGWEFMK